MSRTKAEKRARAATPQFVRTAIPPLPDVTVEQGKEAVKLLVAMTDWGEGSCSFASSRNWNGGTCAQETGRGFDCPMCKALDFLKKIGALDPAGPYVRQNKT